MSLSTVRRAPGSAAKLMAMQGVTSGSQGPIRDRRDAVLMVAGGCLAFLFSVTAGIERWGGLDPIIEGLFIGLCSSLFSCAGAVLSLVLPAQSHWSAYSNLIGSCFAGAAAGYLVPDDKVLQLLALFSAIL